MTTPATAWGRVLEYVHLPVSILVSFADAAGHCLSEDVMVGHDMPLDQTHFAGGELVAFRPWKPLP